MFGHNDHQDGQSDNQVATSDDNNQPLGGLGMPPSAPPDSPAVYGDDFSNQTDSPDTPDDNQPTASSVDDYPPQPANQPVSTDFNLSSSVSQSTTDDQPSSPASVDTSTNELLDIKSQALSQLAPLIDHLDQTPEERFRTIMMMIQASDDQKLIKDAYDIAQGLTDDKSKAQALLDIVNEINYFTHQKNV